MRVGKHLNFDVARALHVFFNQHRIAAKAVDGFALATGKRGGEIFGFFDDPHPLAATARTGFDEHGVADRVGLRLQERGVLIRPVVAGDEGHASGLHQAFGFGLQAHRQNSRRRRADEHQARTRTGMGEIFVLAQKTIARMNGLCARCQSRVDDALPTQIAVLGRTAPNMNRLITRRDMLGLGIGIRKHRHSTKSQTTSRSRHTTSNFAPIGDEDFGEHDE